MATLLFDECCPECGHLLTNDRTRCPFCPWSSLRDQMGKELNGFSNIHHLAIDGDALMHVLPNDAHARAATIL